MSQDRTVKTTWLMAVAACLVLTAANLWFGDLNQDEGWYLYASRLVAEGQMPYRDFAFSQGPVLPFVYSLANPLVSAIGLVGGRLFTAILGIASAALASLLAMRIAPRERRAYAGLIAFMLIGVNVYQSYFTTLVKTYALSSLLLVLGFLALTFVRSRRGAIAAALSGVLMILAGGTRLSAGVAVPVVFVWLLIRALRSKGSNASGGYLATDRTSLIVAVSFAVGAVAMACVIFLPFFVVARDSFLFWTVGYHSGRTGGASALQRLVHVAAFVSRVLQAYFVPMTLLTVVIIRSIFRRRDDDRASDKAPLTSDLVPLTTVMWLCVLVVTVVHMVSPFPYDDYQVMILPVFAAVLAVAVVRLPRKDVALRWILPVVFLISLASCVSSPINQSWVLRERDRIWWRVKRESPVGKLRRVGKIVRELAGPDEGLLTQDTYLAVESGLAVPHGMEMGPFSYFPDLTEELAKERCVLNRDMLKRLLSNCDANVAAFSGYGLAIASPSVTELSAEEQQELRHLVRERYVIEDEIPHFGQALTSLTVFVRKRQETGVRL